MFRYGSHVGIQTQSFVNLCAQQKSYRANLSRYDLFAQQFLRQLCLYEMKNDLSVFVQTVWDGLDVNFRLF